MQLIMLLFFKSLSILFYFVFRNALGDGKRAIILKNNWTKVGSFYILHQANSAVSVYRK